MHKLITTERKKLVFEHIQNAADMAHNLQGAHPIQHIQESVQNFFRPAPEPTSSFGLSSR